MTQTKLRLAVERGTAPGGNLEAELQELGYFQATCLADAREVVRAVTTAADQSLAGDRLIRTIAQLFLQAEGVDVRELLARDGVPQLFRVFDARVAEPSTASRVADLLIVFAHYPSAEGTGRIIRAARMLPNLPSHRWSQVFVPVGEHPAMGRRRAAVDHPEFQRLYEALKHPLPEGTILLPYLAWVNTLAREDGLLPHPFDSDEGVERLRLMILSHEGAVSAVAALPYLKHPARDRLLTLAMSHEDNFVQIEAGWAGAMVGNKPCIALLARFAADPRYTGRASRYLREAGHGRKIPKVVDDPDFRAVADVSWDLQSPEEYARVPDQIALLDTREMYWPPDGKVKRLWLVKYRYTAAGKDGDDVVGVSLAHSPMPRLLETYDLDRLSVDDMYALYCCADSQYARHPDAPADVSVEAGRALLQRPK